MNNDMVTCPFCGVHDWATGKTLGDVEMCDSCFLRLNRV